MNRRKKEEYTQLTYHKVLDAIKEIGKWRGRYTLGVSSSLVQKAEQIALRLVIARDIEVSIERDTDLVDPNEWWFAIELPGVTEEGE